jgi:tripartite-type tricarboxylate transporter receptor subunit TctC
MSTLSTRSFLKLALATAALGATRAFAQDARTVQLVVPFPPGGVVDLVGRAFSRALQEALGQNVVIMNRGGAGGAIGMAQAARADANGLTALATHSAILSIPRSEALFDRKPGFSLASFEPIALLSADPTVLVVHSSAPWKTYDELVKDAKKRGDAITYASSGAYGALHLPIEMLSAAAGVHLRHIPFQGGGPANAAVLGKTVDLTVGSPGTLAPYIKAGTLRPLVITGTKRTPSLPDVPTARELGYDVESSLWVGLFLPKGASKAVIDKYRSAAAQAAKDETYVKALGGAGSELDYRDAPAFQAFLQADDARIAAAIQRIGKVE